MTFKLKLTQPGYENFTGLLGAITFTNGLSDLEHSPETCAGVAAIMQCDRVIGRTDTGEDDVTDPTIIRHDNTGDFDASSNPAPGEPV